MLNIERVLKDGEENSEKKFYKTYSIFKDRLLRYEYTQTSAEFQGGNDHGPGHIERVLENLNDILGPEPLEHISIFELWVAMMAVVYHDVGQLQSRSDHPKIGEELLRSEEMRYIANEREREPIGTAVFTHGSSADIKDKCKKYPTVLRIGGFHVSITRVCALVRLADELDEDHRRGDIEIFRKRDIANKYPESVPFWRFNQCIEGVYIEGPVSDRTSREVEVQLNFGASDITMKVWPGTQEEVSFPVFAAKKILKIIGEMFYCNAFIPESLRFSGIKLILLPGDIVSLSTPRTIHIGEHTNLDDLLSQFPLELRPALTKDSSIEPPKSGRYTLLPAAADGDTLSENDLNAIYDAIECVEHDLGIAREKKIDRVRNGDRVTVTIIQEIADSIDGIRRKLGLPVAWKHWPPVPGQLVDADAFNELLSSVNQAIRAHVPKEPGEILVVPQIGKWTADFEIMQYHRYRARAVRLDCATGTADLEFTGCAAWEVHQKDIRHWIVVGPGNAQLDERSHYVARTSGVWPAGQTLLQIRNVPIWPTAQAYHKAPPNDSKYLSLITGSESSPDDRIFVQQTALKFSTPSK